MGRTNVWHRQIIQLNFRELLSVLLWTWCKEGECVKEPVLLIQPGSCSVNIWGVFSFPFPSNVGAGVYSVRVLNTVSVLTAHRDYFPTIYEENEKIVEYGMDTALRFIHLTKFWKNRPCLLWIILTPFSCFNSYNLPQFVYTA